MLVDASTRQPFSSRSSRLRACRRSIFSLLVSSVLVASAQLLLPSSAGGRIYTVNSTTVPGYPIELGATWIHGYTGGKNPIEALATKLGLAVVKDFEVRPPNSSDLWRKDPS